MAQRKTQERKTQERKTQERKTQERKTNGDQPTIDEVPKWQQESVDRSLQSARLRAQERSDRFVAAAFELLVEREDADCTIQEVVDRSGMSSRTFYTFFDGKDSLLLAVYERILSTTAVPMLRERCDNVADPVERLRTMLDALAEFASMSSPIPRVLTVFHLRLAETRPDDLLYALAPLHRLISELLTALASAGLLRDDVDLATLASLLQEMLVASLHSVVFVRGRQTSTDDLWAFCSAALLRQS
jgi:AcrR family transcriptional regulator